MLSSTADVGAFGEIWLLTTTEMLDAAEPIAISPPVEASHSWVLLIEDDAIVRLNTSDVLADLLISDHVMP